MGWLNGLLESRHFDLIGAPLIAIALSAWLIVGFFKDRGRIKRGEPFNIWYLKYPIYPDDPLYQSIVWRRLTAPIILFVLFGLALLGTGVFVLWFTFWGSPPQP
ncbi:MAG TPA: hypothetical protein VGC16_11860 [Rhizomicrobium sp.]